MTETRNETDDRRARDTHGLLTMGAWLAVVILLINVSQFIVAEVGDVYVNDMADIPALLNGFGIGLLKAMPTLLIALALMDFARMFARCSEGDVFCARNVRTLKRGADSLIWAAVWSAVFAPSSLRWIAGEAGGFDFVFRDLALAVGAMGFALHGLALVWGQAVGLKRENDEFV